MDIRKELQQGNRVKEGTVLGFNYTQPYVVWGKLLETATPIELTEDILIDAGFIETSDNLSKTTKWYRKGKLILEVRNRKNVLFHTEFDSTIIKHLHTLQNLYFIIEQKQLFND